MAISVETFFLKSDAQGTLQTQIQEIIAAGILSGRFGVGEKMPSSRKLAAQLGVSRITVTLAYTELVANDYLTSQGRSGYFVSQTAPVPPSYAPALRGSDQIDWGHKLTNNYIGGDTPRKPQDWRNLRYPFIYGESDATLFDHTNWRQCALRALGKKDFAAMTGDYFDQDDPLLIEHIARHTLPRRGITARPEEILITLGAQNGLWLVAQLLLGRGRKATVEDPGYYMLRDQLNHIGCAINTVPVDAHGMPPEMIAADSDVIFTTPSHQSPTTVTMPMDRRKALLKRAQHINAVVVEDDYEFEMTFQANPSPALKSIDSEGRVVYVGSFSKSLFPGLRLGYLVGSETFIRHARALRASVLRHAPGHVQRTIAYFLSLGHYDAQIRKTGKVLGERRIVLDKAIADHGLTVAGPKGQTGGGSSLWMKAPETVDMTQLAPHLRRQGVMIEPGAAFFAPATRLKQFYRLGYSSIPKDRIPQGVRILAETIDEAQ